MGGPSYTPQLKAHVPTSTVCLPAALLEITTPLISEVWERELASHSDRSFTSYVVNGVKGGFRVGYDCSKTLTSCGSNMASALQHPDVVSDYLEQELLLNRMVVIPPAQVPHIHCHISPFGVICKTGQMAPHCRLDGPPRGPSPPGCSVGGAGSCGQSPSVQAAVGAFHIYSFSRHSPVDHGKEGSEPGVILLR
jgi:hypothetical protein